MNLPNKLTLLRMAMVPVFILCFYLPFLYWNVIATVIFIAAYLTDLYDGYYARKHNLVTNFGKLMDPIADKLLSCSAFIMLTAIGRISPIAVVLIIGRELTVSGFRLVAAGAGNVIAASWLGKVKTITQCVTIVVLLLNNPLFGIIGVPFDQIMVVVTVVFTVWSGVDYIVKNRQTIDFH